MNTRSHLLMLFMTLLVACPAVMSGQADTSLFKYDPKLLSYHQDSVFYSNGIQIKDISITYPGKERQCKAFLLMPAGKGSHPGIVYFHWLGKPNGNRTEFLQEALGMTARGSMCILIQGFFPWKEPPVEGKRDREKIIEQILFLRLATDVLLMQAGIDSLRLGFVGHDYGAMYGAIMAGLDKKFKACVFVAGMGNFGDWAVKYWKGPGESGETAYRLDMAPVDPIGYVVKAGPASFLFQFATQDIYITREAALEFYNAAPEPKAIMWYDTGHEMMIPDVRHDRTQWLAVQLNFSE